MRTSAASIIASLPADYSADFAFGAALAAAFFTGAFGLGAVAVEAGLSPYFALSSRLASIILTSLRCRRRRISLFLMRMFSNPDELTIKDTL